MIILYAILCLIVNSILKDHNCVQSLCNELHNVKSQLEKYKNDIDFYKTEISTLQVKYLFYFIFKNNFCFEFKEFIRITRINDPTI